MKSLYDTGASTEIQQRLDRLSASDKAQWGKMNPAQMMAHCSAAIEVASGKAAPKRMFIGRLIGGLVKTQALGDKPFRRNSPTAPNFVIKDERDFQKEKSRLKNEVTEFAAAGPGKATKHPHSFFGKMSPEEWGKLMYKHLDHHLQQFGK